MAEKRENSKEKEAKRTGREGKAGKGKEEGKKGTWLLHSNLLYLHLFRYF